MLYLSWPIFFSPLDHRIFILPDLFHSKRNAGDLGGVYEYWHNRDTQARGHCLAHRAFYKRDGPIPQLLIKHHPLRKMSHIEPGMLQFPYAICIWKMKIRICTPWQDFDTTTLWLHAADGICDEFGM